MRAYYFDDEGLRNLIDAAFKHGWHEGVQEDAATFNQLNRKDKQRKLDACTWNTKYTEILMEKDPEIYW